MRLFIILLILAVSTVPTHAAKKDNSDVMTSVLFAAMEFRNIGPAYTTGYRDIWSSSKYQVTI